MSLFKKNSEPGNLYDYSHIYQDIHCHLLPGIDDGSPDAATSVAMIKSLMDLGFSRFICTPHVIGDMFRNTPETIGNALAILKKAVASEHLEVQLSAAAEYLLDDYFLELLRNNQPLLMLTGKYILTEISFSSAPDNLEKISFDLINNGYHPLLAHPERYLYYHKNHGIYHRLKELGFLLQVNLLSLTGYYGKPTAKAALYIVEHGLADFVGTDLHHFNHLEALADKRNRGLFQKVLGDKVYNRFGE
ncbi:MAG TPA: CpsB/CapC family capsule biosynthesis tyrosine phosphatase [Chitinophagaceae bacterium]|nr:CpsB/CapC family capsule biosynthesis tyrosine phosphatase [Chitinophagaceae bacterium]